MKTARTQTKSKAPKLRRAIPRTPAQETVALAAVTIHDWRQTNPGLHALYTAWAMHHLMVFKRTIKQFERFSNSNVSDIIIALYAERKKLLDTNTAYQEAAWRMLAGYSPSEVCSDVENYD